MCVTGLSPYFSKISDCNFVWSVICSLFPAKTHRHYNFLYKAVLQQQVHRRPLLPLPQTISIFLSGEIIDFISSNAAKAALSIRHIEGILKYSLVVLSQFFISSAFRRYCICECPFLKLFFRLKCFILYIKDTCNLSTK